MPNVKSADEAPKSGVASQRLLSLDALRGFNMFWIIGGEDLISGILEKPHNPMLKQVSEFFTSHVEWEGFHFYDMI